MGVLYSSIPQQTEVQFPKNVEGTKRNPPICDGKGPGLFAFCPWNQSNESQPILLFHSCGLNVKSRTCWTGWYFQILLGYTYIIYIYVYICIHINLTPEKIPKTSTRFPMSSIQNFPSSLNAQVSEYLTFLGLGRSAGRNPWGFRQMWWFLDV